MSSQLPSKSIIKRCPACGSRVGAEVAVCPICGHEFSIASTPPPAPAQPETVEPVAVREVARKETAAEEPPLPVADVDTGDEQRADLPPTTPIALPQFKSPTKPIPPITKPVQPKTAHPQAGAPISKPVPKPEPADKRVTGASKAVRPATVMMDPSATPLRRIPWGVVGVMAVVLGLAAGAIFLLRGITGSTAGNGIQVTMQQPTLANSETLPTLAVGEVGAPTADPAAAQAAPAEAPPASPTETPAPTLPPVSPTPVPPQEYTVVSGDTCGTIAEKFGVRLAPFMALNSLNDSTCTRIRIGDKLLIPAPTPTPGPSPTPQPPGAQSTNNEPVATLPAELTYEVLPGDVCSKIAQKFTGLTTDQIIKLNNLDANCTIQIGQKLVLKFASAPAAATSAPQVAMTATPRIGYAAPLLVSPQEGTAFTETQQVITLQWLSAGLLKENEYYVIEIQPQGETIVPIYETKATSLKLSQELVGDQIERSFRWFVSVKQKLATDPKTNQPIYNDLSPQSEARRFVWRKPQGTPTPTP